jgi:hypothetical protein
VLWCQKSHGFTLCAKPSSPLPTKATHPTRLDESLAGKGKLAHNPTTAEPAIPTLASSGGAGWLWYTASLFLTSLLLDECTQSRSCALPQQIICATWLLPSISPLSCPLDSSYLSGKVNLSVIRSSDSVDSPAPLRVGAWTPSRCCCWATPRSARDRLDPTPPLMPAQFSALLPLWMSHPPWRLGRFL